MKVTTVPVFVLLINVLLWIKIYFRVYNVILVFVFVNNYALNLFWIHVGYGWSSDGVTTFINASSCNIRYDPVNKPVIFDIAVK